MSVIKKPYEISLWEDVLTFVVKRLDGTEKKYEKKLPEDITGEVIAQYYQEKKICIIGSDTMNTPIRATQPKLVSKVNGENVLTFNMYSHYYDNNSDTYVINPFIGLLINERKIKLRYGAVDKEDTEWYDLIIKNIQENSDTKTYTYTAKDLFVNELSKSGFSLEFNSELENNMGNIETLAGRVLEGSDWQLKSTGKALKQTVEEPLYHIELNKNIKVKDMEEKADPITIEKGEWIYVFYNNIVNEQSFTQLLYVKQEGSENPYISDSDHIITNSPNWILENVTYNDKGIPDFTNALSISDKYRGRRLVRKARTEYDATIDKYVNVYQDNKKEIYGYTETEYSSPATVRSYITNPSDYNSYSGWKVGGIKVNNETTFPSLDLVSVPDVRDVSADDIKNGNVNFLSCLKFQPTNTSQVLYNSGIIDHRSHINGFVKGEQYVFRIKYGKAKINGDHGAKELESADINLTFKIRKYKLEDGVYQSVDDDKDQNDDVYFSGTITSVDDNSATDYKSIKVECLKSLSQSEMVNMSNSLGLFIQSHSTRAIYIEDVQFFPYISNGDDDDGFLLPSEFSNSQVKTIYYYYIPNDDYKSIDDINFIYKGESPADFAEVYDGSGYEKVRTITASESNRFNLIQELCELFECWPKFEIEHKSSGEIELDGNYRQRKWVSFHEYIGKDNYIGFKYGINLKSIQRTIESDAIVSKLVVKNNSNEFATDGFCSISRSSENPCGENFILDFSYYIQQGLLGFSELTNDLYSNFNGFQGYYKKLKEYNAARDLYIKEQSGLLADISEYTAAQQTYSTSAAEANQEYADKLTYINSLTGCSFEDLIADPDNTWWSNSEVVSTISAIGRLKAVGKNHDKLAKQAEENLKKAQDQYDKLTRILTSKEKGTQEEPHLLFEKEQLHLKFYKKYSRFLQEGSWISEDYVDDNLYFLDAQSTLHTSSQPKVTYNISVLELSQLEGYENFVFALGDKTTIEDTEFFGWTINYNTGIKTPYKEEIIVTELTVMLDQPEQNQIKVQNYKSQFEDLFQRMAATTQSVEYSTGKYKKAAGIVEEDGTINIVTLQNSIANNALVLENAKDQTVIWDETGITTISATRPAEVVRIVSGGIFLSIDGGITWNTGITGAGINANYITTGTLNVSNINILNGAFSSFRWDTSGISAYTFTLDENSGIPSNFNYSNFVRFDQYGIYGINGTSEFNSSEKDSDGLVGEAKIWKHSNFALTWRGFQIKSDQVDGGYVSITSQGDFQVFGSNGKEKIKIGNLAQSGESSIYGIQLRDDAEQVVMEHSNDGKIWIRNELKVGNEDISVVTIGYLNNTKESDSEKSFKDFTGVEDKDIHQVINANNRFIVYEDGSMKATDGEFTGVIYATGGKIGQLEIASIPDPNYKVVIISDNGAVFTDDKNKVLTALLYKGATLIEDENLKYQWYKNQDILQGKTSKNLEVKVKELTSGQASYRCIIEYIQEGN